MCLGFAGQKVGTGLHLCTRLHIYWHSLMRFTHTDYGFTTGNYPEYSENGRFLVRFLATASILDGLSPGRLLLASFRNRNVVDDVDNAVGGFYVGGCGNATINDQSAVFVIEHQAFALKSYGGALVEEFSRFLLAFQVVVLENFL